MPTKSEVRSLSLFVPAVLCFVFIAPGYAAVESPVRTPRTQVNRQEVVTQEIQQAATDIDAYLQEILRQVNELKQPTAQRLAAADQSLQQNRKHVEKFDSAVECRYFLLNAWTCYFQNDIPKAYMAASRAFKADQTNRDAHISQFVMSILADRKPMPLTPPKPVPDRTRTDRRRPDPSRPDLGMQPNQMMMGGFVQSVLNFDIDAVDLEMLGRKISPMNLTCVNSTTFSYEPQQANLCVLVWKMFSKPEPKSSSEPNIPSAPGSPGRRQPARPDMPVRPDMPTMPGMMPGGEPGMYPPGYMMPQGPQPGYGGGYDALGQPKDPLTQQTDAFAEIFLAEVANPSFRFVAVNTDEISNKGKVLDKVFQSPWPWAQVIAADSTSAYAQFSRMNAAKPMLVVVDKTGAVKYAGPAVGFIPRMVIAYLRNPAQGVIKSVDTEPAVSLPADSNSISNVSAGIKSPLQVMNTPQSQAQPAEQYRQLSLEEQLSADRLIQYAEQLFIPAAKKHFITPKRGVEICREIIEKYPGTEYAQRARMLLRKVPDQEKPQFNITKEEMGL